MNNLPELNQIRVPCRNLQVIFNRNNKVLNEESKRRLCYMFHVSKHPVQLAMIEYCIIPTMDYRDEIMRKDKESPEIIHIDNEFIKYI
jgi:hypothetical protein